MTEPPPQEPPRVVIDTSTTLPILTGAGVDDHWLVNLWQSGRIIPLANNETIAELREKVLEHSPYAKDNQARLFVNKTLDRYEPMCEFVQPAIVEGTPQCRDSTDQMFIDLAVAGQADYLIARDPDLLVMDGETAFRIVHDGEARHLLATN